MLTLLSAFLSLLKEGPGFSRKQQLSPSSLKPSVSELTLHLKFSCQWCKNLTMQLSFLLPQRFYEHPEDLFPVTHEVGITNLGVQLWIPGI